MATAQMTTEASAHPLDHGNAPGFAYLAMRSQLEGVSSNLERKKIKQNFKGLQTHQDLKPFFESARAIKEK
jgi:hypothetical protein